MNRTHNRYCRGDRRRGTPFSRYGRGFTTIELAVSLALFLFLSVFISLAVSRALSTTAEARAVRGAEAVAADVLSQVETAPYPELVAGTFSVPDPCAGNTATGIQATTCTKMGNVDVVLSYQYVDVPTGTTTPVCSSTTTTGTRTATAYGYVGLCASVTSIAGSPAPDTLAPVMKRVNAPSPKFAPDGGVVRVTVGGDTSLLPSQTLYLVKENDPSHIMGSGQIASDHIAYISTFGAEANTADTAACTTASPCMLVATPINGGAASPAVSGAGALYGSAARPGARISTPTGIVRDVGVTVGGLSTLRMDATARNGDTVARATPSAQDGIPSITNTICLWATFDDNGTHSSQICNSNPSNPGLLSASTYRNGANLWPLPATNVTVTTDHPSGRCLAGEQTGYVPGGNGSTAPGSVCTSWTWGVPSTLPATVALNPGSTTRLDRKSVV